MGWKLRAQNGMMGWMVALHGADERTYITYILDSCIEMGREANKKDVDG